MTGIAGGEKAEKLADNMPHREVQMLDDGKELVADCRDDVERELEEEGLNALEDIEMPYAAAFREGDTVVLARDILGVKPLWYSRGPFAFASEKRALEAAGREARELHPRTRLNYKMETGDIELETRDFFEVDLDEGKELEQAAEEVKNWFLKAVWKRVPEDGELALLFSGGVDSTMIAAALHELEVDFTCYTGGIQHGNTARPRDSEWAEKVAEDMGLELESYEATLEEVEDAVPELVDWISSTSPVKIGVALPFYFALDGDESIVMSGLGSEQLYGGYSRQKEGYLNQEALSGLRSLFHEDLYRDNVVSMRAGYELRLPFLDHELIQHALTVPGDYKVENGHRKYVLRLAAEKLGVSEEVAWREKRAAQYGSNFDKALSRLAKDAGKTKQEYLNQFRGDETQGVSEQPKTGGFQLPNARLAALTSGGKDSNAALYRMECRNNEIACLVNLQSRNPDSYMFDTKQRDIVEEQADELGIPLIVQGTEGEKEDELEDLEEALQRAVEEYGVEGVVAGALASTYQRDRVEKVAEKLGLKAFAPLWMQDQESYMKWLVNEGFKVEITEVAARGLDENWVGRTLDGEAVEQLVELSREYGFNAAGEGGEYETRVVGFPAGFL